MRQIFLIGLSGSGKSTVGRMLARRCGRSLYDVDALVEEECGERIPAIFARHGEEYFRTCESRILARLAQKQDGSIIATGGGIVIRPENRTLMAEQGVRIYLAVDPASAVERMQTQHAQAIVQGDAPELRPLLAGPDPLSRIQGLLTARVAWYQEAEIQCSTRGKSIESVVQEIIAMLLSSGEINGPQPLVRHVHVAGGYDTVVDWGGLGRLGSYLKQLQLPTRVFLFTDSNLEKLYAPALLQQLRQAGFEPSLYVVPAGEASKSQRQLSAIYDWLVEQHAERREALIALGGGVVGDLVGYAAASYLRGVPLIQVPTSLLAQVDSAIGGKTGINHEKGKNLIGAFYHPRLVLADPALLLTLPTRERTEGWAEIVKYGIILDAELFALLEEHADALRAFQDPPAALVCQIIARCIDLKVRVIEEDEREQGLRAILNYGHTLGHALENVSGYGEWLHGEAVSLGMVAAATLAVEAGFFTPEDAARQNALLEALGLPIIYRGEVRAQDLLAKIQLDKKVAGKRVRWIMPRRIGEVFSTNLPDELVAKVTTAFFVEERS
ncbi:MAG TPA: 3-dehydroquinate synthase [Ktedonobacteraceae bacterium]|jgi:3-dehydroquinate synthase